MEIDSKDTSRGQKRLSVEEKATLFQQLLEKRRKHFATERAEEQRNKPPTQAQQIKIMCSYLKNMEGKKLKDLKKKSFDSIQKMFDRAFKRQKVDEDKDTIELQSLMEVIPDEEEVTINVVPLAVKSPSIVGWKIYKEGKKRRLGRDLYKLVKAKYGSTRSVEDLDLVLWNDLKTMFEPHVEDEIWKLQQRYPLTTPTIIDMLNKKLQGRIVGIKSLLNAASITATLIDVNVAQSKLVLLENFNKNDSKCLRLLVKLLLLEEVTTASGS
ncbi:hypothetical protein Tco_1145438 [Tanacetum coccineum]